MLLTKRQVLLKYRFNGKTFQALVDAGVISPVLIKPGKRPTVFFGEETLMRQLQENEHYVICSCCGALQNQITSKHLNVCSGLDLREYQQRFPDAECISRFSRRRRAKTPAQRQTQSQCLKDRFQTSEGEQTRRLISLASKRMMASDYRERASRFLTDLNRTPAMRKLRSEQSKERWAHGDMRAKIRSWHVTHRDESLRLAHHARCHIRKKRSNLHMEFKTAMINAGLTDFITEFVVGFFHIDEGNPILKLAVEVNGCYWHSCPQCGLQGPPATLETDKRKRTYLTNRGWRVLVFWEHEIRSDIEICLSVLRKAVQEAEENGPRHQTADPASL